MFGDEPGLQIEVSDVGLVDVSDLGCLAFKLKDSLCACLLAMYRIDSWI